jgi:GNAT superfamily N-acetyltransferase
MDNTQHCIQPINTGHVRLFRHTDYSALVDFIDQVTPTQATSSESMQQSDAIPRSSAFSRLIWVSDTPDTSNIQGYADIEKPPYFNPTPGVAQLRFRATETALTELWAQAKQALYHLQPQQVISGADEHRHELGFLQAQGFVETDRMWASTLDVATARVDGLLEQAKQAKDSGVVIYSFAELPNTPEFWKRHYTLMIELIADIPSHTPTVPWSYEVWIERWRNRPGFLPNGYFFAVVDDTLVGVSEHWATAKPEQLQIGLTGVRQPWRRRGIAAMLKLHAVEFARKHGYQRIRTVNHSINRPMLTINEAMGYVKEPAWVNLVLDGALLSTL